MLWNTSIRQSCRPPCCRFTHLCSLTLKGMHFYVKLCLTLFLRLTLQMWMLQTSLFLSEGEKINCLSFVSHYSALLCARSASVNWPLMHLTALFSCCILTDISLCSLLGFSHAHHVIVEGWGALSEASLLSGEAKLSEFAVSMLIGAGVYAPICCYKLLVSGPEHRLKKTGTVKRAN